MTTKVKKPRKTVRKLGPQEERLIIKGDHAEALAKLLRVTPKH